MGDARDDRWAECVGRAGDPGVAVGGERAPSEWSASGSRWLGAVAGATRRPLTDREKLTMASMDLAAGLRTLEGMRDA